MTTAVLRNIDGDFHFADLGEVAGPKSSDGNNLVGIPVGTQYTRQSH